MPTVTIKTDFNDLTEKDFKVLFSSIENLSGDLKEDFCMLNVEGKIENFNINKDSKVIVTNLEKFNDNEKVRLTLINEYYEIDANDDGVFTGDYYFDLRGLEKEEILNIFSEVEIKVNYYIKDILQEDVYKVIDNNN